MPGSFNLKKKEEEAKCRVARPPEAGSQPDLLNFGVFALNRTKGLPNDSTLLTVLSLPKEGRHSRQASLQGGCYHPARAKARMMAALPLLWQRKDSL